MQYHAIPCNTMQYHAIQCDAMQHHAIPCNIMQYHTSLITSDGAYHCPAGSIRPSFYAVVVVLVSRYRTIQQWKHFVLRLNFLNLSSSPVLLRGEQFYIKKNKGADISMYYVPHLFHFTVFQRGAVLHQEEVGEGISQLVAQLQREEELREN